MPWSRIYYSCLVGKYLAHNKLNQTKVLLVYKTSCFHVTTLIPLKCCFLHQSSKLMRLSKYFLFTIYRNLTEVILQEAALASCVSCGPVHVRPDMQKATLSANISDERKNAKKNAIKVAQNCLN